MLATVWKRFAFTTTNYGTAQVVSLDLLPWSLEQLVSVSMNICLLIANNSFRQLAEVATFDRFVVTRPTMAFENAGQRYRHEYSPNLKLKTKQHKILKYLFTEPVGFFASWWWKKCNILFNLHLHYALRINKRAPLWSKGSLKQK